MKSFFCALFCLLPSSLPAQERDVDGGQWSALFDGETLQGWTTSKGEAVEEGKWVAEEGVLTRASIGAGDLYSAKEYGDFEFSFEWKLSENGNSGVKYRVAPFGQKFLGLEYQILDDEGHPDGKHIDHQTAALYDLKRASAGKKLNPVGQWNASRIVVREGKVQHFLNEELVVEIEIPSEEWEDCFTQSKYVKNEGFGVNAKGRLLLQDHGNKVSFRSLKIREF